MEMWIYLYVGWFDGGWVAGMFAKLHSVTSDRFLSLYKYL